ncbi:MAG: bifunctional folylpolyglutamate synthase/dihydrofolate synthase, partial [Acidobacteriota bacterium]
MLDSMNTTEQLQYLYGLERFGIKPGLERIQAVLKLLGHPERQYNSIHIAGTNGKGSTAAMLAAILSEAGLRVGLYVSPHIYSFTERIQVSGEAISPQDLAVYVRDLRFLSEKHEIPLTFFEFTTAIAFQYFADHHVDVAVVEVGMGGLFDATNVITPKVAVITNIGLDHTAYLGKTKKAIAEQKAGIIKQGVPIVTTDRGKESLAVITQTARRHKAPLVHVDDYIAINAVSTSLTGQHARVQGVWQGDFHLPLLGAHQLRNTATALTAAWQLREQGVELNWTHVRNGLATTRWDGRLDVLSLRPLIVLDGAHNADGARALRDFIDDWERHDVLVLGLKQGNSLAPFMKHILPKFKRVIVTEGNYQPIAAAQLGKLISRRHPKVYVEPLVPRAMEKAKELLPSQGTLLIT